MRRIVKVASSGAALTVAGALVWSGAVAHADTAGRVPVPTDQPAWVATASPAADAPADTRVQVRVYLTDRDQAGLAALVHEVSDPHSAQYRHFLTPDAFRARFAPTDATLAGIRSWLTGSGMSVTEVPANRLYVTAVGTPAAAGKAFGTTLRVYQHDGRSVRAASSPATVPTGLSAGVLAVTGLSNQSAHLARTAHDAGAGPETSPEPASNAVPQSAPPPPGLRTPSPCSSYYGQKQDTKDPTAYGKAWPYAVCGYTPQQLQSAYLTAPYLAAGKDGRGTTVAIIGAYDAPGMLADANTYAGRHGLPAFTAGQYTEVLPPGGFHGGYGDGDECGEQVWYLEQSLDVEAVHALAPGTSVTYMASASCDDADFLTSLNTVVDQHLADTASNSWYVPGEGDDAVLGAPYHQTFEQAAAEGIGMYFASGDYGDDVSIPFLGKPAVNFPCADPLVTAIGGTGLAIGSSMGYGFETGWSIGASTLTDGAWSPAPPGVFSRGSGGGTATSYYAEPDYQKGVVPDSLATANGGTPDRVVPDISMDGENETGFITGQTQVFPDGTYYDERRIGGTSLSTPLFAALTAILIQIDGPTGFINPALYNLAGTSAFHDIVGHGQPAQVRLAYTNGADSSAGVVTSLRTDEFPQTIAVAPGYDNVTGLGSPNVPGLFKALGPIGQ